MNNKLRIVLNVIISILIWLGVSIFVLMKSTKLSSPICPCPQTEGSVVLCDCGFEPELTGLLGENIVLGSIIYFIVLPGVLVLLFNIFFLKKKPAKR